MFSESAQNREQQTELRSAARAQKARSVFSLFPELKGRTWLEFLREELHDEPSLSLHTFGRDPITVSVDVRSKRGHITVHLSREKLEVYGDLWDRGVSAGRVASFSLADTAPFLRAALAGDTPLATVQAEMPFFRASEAGLIQDEGVEAYLDFTWKNLLYYLEESSQYLQIARAYALAQVVSQAPKLRQLRAYTSYSRFCFSRCTGYPFTYDCPSANWIGDDQFEVYAPTNPPGDWHKNGVGKGDVFRAAQLLVEHLPPNCGPAVLGTADNFRP